jgi:hypothetical protein
MTGTNSNNQLKLSPKAITVIPFLVALVVALFAWPSSRLEPRDLPVGVAGPPAAAEQIAASLEAQDGAFEVHRYTDDSAARQAIEDRDVYGAFVVTPSGPETLVSSGASFNVSQLLTDAGAKQAKAAGAQAKVVDVVPGGNEDQRGTGLSSSVLPMVLAGVLVGIAASMLSTSIARRAILVLIGSVLAGGAAMVIAQSWLGIVNENWLANWGALSLIVLSISSLVAGFEALLGPPGIAVGSLTMILIGNPFAAVSSAPEMLPQPLGVIGQLMPPGAGGNLLRSSGFFDGAGAGGHAAVLVGWAALGLGMMAVAAMRFKRVAVRGPQPVAVGA